MAVVKCCDKFCDALENERACLFLSALSHTFLSFLRGDKEKDRELPRGANC